MDPVVRLGRLTIRSASSFIIHTSQRTQGRSATVLFQETTSIKGLPALLAGFIAVRQQLPLDEVVDGRLVRGERLAPPQCRCNVAAADGGHAVSEHILSCLINRGRQRVGCSVVVTVTWTSDVLCHLKIISDAACRMEAAAGDQLFVHGL